VGPIEAASLALSDTWTASTQLLKGLAQMARFQVRRDEVAGPLGIAIIVGEAFSYGWDSLFWLVAFISVNLAIVNLLPIPILDGCTLMYLTIEAVTRRPLTERVMLAAQQVGLVFLILIFLLLTVNDLNRLLPFSIFGGSG
jgi:regulator of sigma E protease